MEKFDNYKKLINHYKIDYPVLPPCACFGVCGGCQWQDVPYTIQVSRKKTVLQKLFKRDIYVFPSPKEYEYRSRMDFVVAFGNIGFRPIGTYTQVIDVQHCYLMPDKTNYLLQRVKYWLRRLGIPEFNYTEHKGFMRYVVIRQTSTGELMLILLTSSPQPHEEKLIPRLVEMLLKEISIKSCWWVTQDGLADLSRGVPKQFWGDPYIREQIDTLHFNIGPNTFFQTNKEVAEQCFKLIRESLAGVNVLDLYCGTGTISFFLSSREREIIGVESDPESIKIAEINSKQNDCTNVRFLNSDVRKFLIKNTQSIDTVVLDPPRSGAGRKVIERLVRQNPRRIIYMSCNPDAFMEDCSYIRGYDLKSVYGFDMFPQTTHVEIIGIFDKR